MRLPIALATLLAIGCRDDKPQGPPVPSRSERLATAEAIDTARGFGDFTIGQPKGKLVNVGHPDSYEYFDGGVKLSVFRKARVKVKVGDVDFRKLALYFGRTNEMQMYRLYSESDRTECDTAKANFDALFGPGFPKAANRFEWVGHEIQARWEHSQKAGKSLCFMEVRAVTLR